MRKLPGKLTLENCIRKKPALANHTWKCVFLSVCVCLCEIKDLFYCIMCIISISIMFSFHDVDKDGDGGDVTTEHRDDGSLE